MAEPAGLHRPRMGVSAVERQRIRKHALVSAGFDLFGTRGIAAVTIEEVCRNAKLNKRYFYESFESIDALATAVVNKTLRDLGTGLIPHVLAGGMANPRPAVDYFVRTVMSDPRLARLLFVEVDTGGLAHQRQRFIDLAVDLWTGADPKMPNDPRQREVVRMGAYGYGGACREIIIATLNGKLNFTVDEVVDHLTKLLEQLVAQQIS